MSLKKRWKIIVGVTLIATIISAITSFFIIKPMYKSTTSIFIGKDTSIEENQYTSNDIAMYHKLMKTYATVAESQDVVENAIEKGRFEDINVGEFKSALTVTPQADTQIIDIKIQYKDPEEAKKMLEALSESFFEKVEELYPNGNISIIDTPRVNENPISPNKMLNIAIAMVLGFMVSIGVCILLEYMDSTIKKEDEVSKYLGLPVIGTIPDHEV